MPKILRTVVVLPSTPATRARRWPLVLLAVACRTAGLIWPRPLRHASSRRGRLASAQPPAAPAPARAPAADARSRYPPELRGHRPLATDRRDGRRPRARLRPVPSRTARPALTTETVRLGCVDCHGGNPQAADKQPGPRLAALSRRLAKLGQPGPVLHAAEPRIARVHPLRQSRRPARRPPELRHDELPRRGGAPESARA